MSLCAEYNDHRPYKCSTKIKFKVDSSLEIFLFRSKCVPHIMTPTRGHDMWDTLRSGTEKQHKISKV